MHFHVGESFCKGTGNVLDELLDFQTHGSPINECQCNLLYMMTFLYFVPACISGMKRLSSMRDTSLSYTPLLRMANSHTGRFAQQWHYRADGMSKKEFLITFSCTTLCLGAWFAMAGYEFLNSTALEPVSVSRCIVIATELLQWSFVFIYVYVLKRKDASPSFRFLRTFWCLQFFVSLVSSLISPNLIWAYAFNTGNFGDMSRLALFVCSGWLSLYCIVSFVAEHVKDSMSLAPPFAESLSATDLRDEEGALYPQARRTFSTPKTVAKGSGYNRRRRTPEKKLWRQFHDVTAQAEADMTVPPTPPRCSDELSQCIAKQFHLFTHVKAMNPDKSIEILFDNSGYLKIVAKNDAGSPMPGISETQSRNENNSTASGKIDGSQTPSSRRSKPVTSPGSPFSAENLASVTIGKNVIVTMKEFEDFLTSFVCDTVHSTLVEQLDFSKIYLFGGAAPVFVSSNWMTARRLVLVVPSVSERVGGGGIWSLSSCIENGLSYGSLLLLCEQAMEDNCGVIILNPVQYENGSEHPDAEFTKLIAATKTVLASGENLTFDHVRESLLSQGFDKNSVRAHSRTVRSLVQYELLQNDDGPTRRLKVAWDTLVSKSTKANHIIMASHRHSYDCALRSYRYASGTAAANSYAGPSAGNRLRACVFMEGTREDYLSFRSLQNVEYHVEDVYSLGQEVQVSPLITTIQGQHRKNNSVAKIYRIKKKQPTNDEVRLIQSVENELQEMLLYLDGENYFFYVKAE